MYIPPFGKIFEIPLDPDNLKYVRRYVVSIDPLESIAERNIIVLHQLSKGEKNFDFEVQYGPRVISFLSKPIRLPLRAFTAKEIDPIDQMPKEKIKELELARTEAEKEMYYFDPYSRL